MVPSENILEISSSDKKKVADAAARLGYRVTEADIASATGFSLMKSELTLKDLIGLSGGTLEVDESGQLVYRFPPGFRNSFFEARLASKLKTYIIPLYKISEYLARCFVGFMLIISPVCFIAFITLASMGELTGRRGSGQNVTLLDLLTPFLSLFRWRYHPDQYENTPSFLRHTFRDEASFGYDIITFMGGMGSHREEFERSRWQQIASLIRRNGGVVIQEELAPYMASKSFSESEITQVLLRFNGSPLVTDSGNTVYIFPSLQVSTNEMVKGDVEDYLMEESQSFSTATGSRATFLWSFALCNLIFYLLLLRFYADNPIVTASSIFLMVYITFGILFALMPTARWFKTQITNRSIRALNQARKEAWEKVTDPDPELSKHLEEASRYRLELKHLDGSGIEYHTESTLLEQQLGEQLPAYLNEKRRPVTVEPEFQYIYHEALTVLDKDSVILKPSNPLEDFRSSQSNLSLSGTFGSIPVNLYIESQKLDYDRLELSVISRYALHLEICKNVFDRPLAEICPGNACHQRYPQNTLFKPYNIFSSHDAFIPTWFMDDVELKALIPSLFKEHPLDLLVIHQGITIKSRPSKIKNLSLILEIMCSINRKIESHTESLAETWSHKRNS